MKVSELAEKVKRYKSQKKFLHELVFLVDQIQGGKKIEDIVLEF